MRRLAVLFDPRCGPCRRFRQWIALEPAFVRLDVLSARSREAERRFPALPRPGEAHADLVVVGDRGEVWRGAKAWRMCLWALRRWRETSLSERLSRGALWEHDRAPEVAAPAVDRRAEPSGSALGGFLAGLGGLLFWMVVVPALVLAICAVPAWFGDAVPALRIGVLAVAVLLLARCFLRRPSTS